MEDVNMLTNINTAKPISISIPNFPNWPTLLEALQQLLPPVPTATPAASFPSETLLKLYTIVFDYCVGTGVTGNQPGKGISAFMQGEELYKAVVAFISARFIEWSNGLSTLENALTQMNCIAAAEKPLIFIFTYLERHWIDRQIHDQRADVLPMKQLLWQQYDTLVLSGHLGSLLPVLLARLEDSWSGRVEMLEELKGVAVFVNYLRVISTPGLVESDFQAVKRQPAAGLLINPRAAGSNRFGDFVQWYRTGISSFISAHLSGPVNESWIERALTFWNNEEGRMVYLRFDKNAGVAIRTCLKETLLLPNLEALKEAFTAAIMAWNVLQANAVYRLLANRKSLLVHLDAAAQEALVRKGTAFLSEIDTSSEHCGQQFVTLLGQFYNLSTELIQTALASRPEIFEARARAFRVLLNGGRRAKFAARSLALCADYVCGTFPEITAESESMLTILMALFRLLDEKNEFGEMYGNLLARRLLLWNAAQGTAKSGTEAELLARLTSTCGPAFTTQFDRMHADVQGSQTTGVTLLTGGMWNLKGKRLLPGHPILTANATAAWPEEGPIAAFEAAFRADSANRSKRLNWIPALSPVHFDLVWGQEEGRVAVRASCAQLALLQQIAAGQAPPVNGHDELQAALMAPMIKSGLVSRDGRSLLPQPASSPALLDVFEPLISDLLSTGSNHHSAAPSAPGQIRSFSTTGTPSRKSTVPGAGTTLSPADKQTLLQCQISRLLKQLRSLTLAELYNRLSMLPVLLSRFSPEFEEVDAAVRALAEKEFVQVVLVDGGEETLLTSEDAMLDRSNCDLIQVRYVA